MEISLEPPVIVICGSTRFIKEMKRLELILTWQGNVVFAPTICDLKTSNPLWDKPEDFLAGAKRLAEVHYAAMRKANLILVVGDYAGKSVKEEIAYANELGLPIFFTEPSLAIKFQNGSIWGD